VDERALSCGELFQQAKNMAEKRGDRSDKTPDETARTLDLPEDLLQ
jgi:hypothetical protein